MRRHLSGLDNGIDCRRKPLAKETDMSSDVIKVGQMEIRYLVDGSKSGGLGVFELIVPPGANVPPPHSHSHNEEFFYVVEGSIGYSVDGESRELAPGQWMSTPRGSVQTSGRTTSATSRRWSMPEGRQTGRSCWK